MSTCHCDGPPHTYDPRWCGSGRDGNGRPIAYPQPNFTPIERRHIPFGGRSTDIVVNIVAPLQSPPPTPEPPRGRGRHRA